MVRAGGSILELIQGYINQIVTLLTNRLPATLDTGALRVREQNPLSEPFDIETADEDSIVIDLLRQGAYAERRSTISNNGVQTTYTNPTGNARRGKFFPRGCRGFINTIDIYCVDNAAAGGTITVYLAPYPGAECIYTADVTVPAGGGWAWRSATFNEEWNYDGLFIYTVGSNINMRQGMDTGTPYDYYSSADAGVTWATLSYRLHFQAVMKGETIGDVTVSGSVIVERVPVQQSGVLVGDTAIKIHPGQVYWITCIGTTNEAFFQLNDSVDNTGIDMWQGLTSAGARCLHCVFNPPLPFNIGIYLDVDGECVSVVVGYY